MKNGKAAGLDNIFVEEIKHFEITTKMAVAISLLFSTASQEKTPPNLKTTDQ